MTKTSHRQIHIIKYPTYNILVETNNIEGNVPAPIETKGKKNTVKTPYYTATGGL